MQAGRKFVEEMVACALMQGAVCVNSQRCRSLLRYTKCCTKKHFKGETFRGEMGFRMSVDLIGRECDKVVVVELTCAGPLRLLDLMYGTAGGGGIFSTCFGS
jgi:hypothetical protein